MGKPMAHNLLQAHDHVTVYDANEAVTKEFKSTNAIIGESAQKAAAGADVVILMLPNSQVVEKVVLGEQGISQEMKKGSLIIDMSTSAPSSTKIIAEEVENNGLYFLDAPVSGGVKKAVSGELTIMVGGDESQYERSLNVLEPMGKEIFHVGKVSSGHTMKALNNLLSAAHFLATSEVLVAGNKAGLEPEKMLEVINASTGRNHSSETKFPNFVLNREFNSGFSMDLITKDIELALEITKEFKTPAFLSSTVYEVWRLANKLSEGKYDHTEMAKFCENWGDVTLNYTEEEKITHEKRNS
nr:NAD(P)-dependent oxidoreductase [Alkalicoccus halolimnae]